MFLQKSDWNGGPIDEVIVSSDNARNCNIDNPDVRFVHGHSLRLSHGRDNERHRTVNRDNCIALSVQRERSLV